MGYVSTIKPHWPLGVPVVGNNCPQDVEDGDVEEVEHQEGLA